MRPGWLRSSARRDRPFCRARVWKWNDVDLVAASLVRDVSQPSSVGGKRGGDFGKPARDDGHRRNVDSGPHRENVTRTARIYVGLKQQPLPVGRPASIVQVRLAMVLHHW